MKLRNDLVLRQRCLDKIFLAYVCFVKKALGDLVL